MSLNIDFNMGAGGDDLFNGLLAAIMRPVALAK